MGMSGGHRSVTPAAVVLSGLLPAMLALAACTTITYESYRPVQNPNVDILYVADGADFSRYRRLLPEDVGIFFPTSSRPSDADLDRVRTAFRDAFLEQIADYERVRRPAADVLKVRGSLVDLRATDAQHVPNLAADLNRILEPGKLTFLIEMRDSVTDRLLLRAADTEKSPPIDLAQPGTDDTDELYAAAQHWAVLFRNFLDQNLGHVPEAPRGDL